MQQDNRPIIIVKKKAAHAGHHGGAWKVAYADFVTAMMAFFLVMWILGLNSNVRKSIAAYFNDPVGFSKTHGGGSSPMSVGRDSPRGRPSLLPGLSTLLHDSPSDYARFKAAKKALETELSKSPQFMKMRSSVEIAITREGLRIELVESRQTVFFDSGSDHLKPTTIGLLAMIGRELAKMPNPVAIEGHTDSQPYTGGMAGYSNFELSASRANAARRVLATILKGDKVTEVRGYADRHLRNPSNPLDASNRRVSILVQCMMRRPDVTDSDKITRGIHVPDAGVPEPSEIEAEAARAAGAQTSAAEGVHEGPIGATESTGEPAAPGESGPGNGHAAR